MVENHLFIGLGGTGGSILRYLHDRIEAEDWELQDVGFSFLYVDCINEQVEVFDQDKFFLLGNHEFTYQNRTIGRKLFAAAADDLDKRIQHCCYSPKHIHLFSGLAGGIGSGCLVDLLALVHHIYPWTDIEVHAVLPSRKPLQGHDAGYYHANGYAALQELEAWGKEHPFADSQLWLHLYEDENTEGELIGMKDLHSMIADVNYLSVIHNDSIRDLRSMIIDYYKTSYQDSSYPYYFSFGLMKHVFSLTKLVKRHIHYALLLGIINRLLYNHFVENQGYVEKPLGMDHKYYINTHFDYLIGRIRSMSHRLLNKIPFDEMWHKWTEENCAYQNIRDEHLLDFDIIQYLDQTFQNGYDNNFVNHKGVRNYVEWQLSEYLVLPSQFMGIKSPSYYDKREILEICLLSAEDEVGILKERRAMFESRMMDDKQDLEFLSSQYHTAPLARLIRRKEIFEKYRYVLKSYYQWKSMVTVCDRIISILEKRGIEGYRSYLTYVDSQVNELQELKRIITNYYEDTAAKIHERFLSNRDSFVIAAIEQKKQKSLCNKKVINRLLLKWNCETFQHNDFTLYSFLDLNTKKRTGGVAKVVGQFQELEQTSLQQFVADAMRQSRVRIALMKNDADTDTNPHIWYERRLYIPNSLDAWKKRKALLQAFMQAQSQSLADDRVVRTTNEEMDVLQLCGGFTLQMLKVYPILRDAYERVKNTYDNKQ